MRTPDASDWGASRISAKYSSDGGLTWGSRFTLLENQARMNVMDPTLLRLQSGELAFFHSRKNSHSDLQYFVRRSFDEGKTWTKSVNVTQRAGYHTVNNDRAIQLRGGRILVPIAYTPDIGKQNHLKTYVAYSDDGGQSWKENGQELDLPGRGVLEPGVVELKDGSVLMVIRTTLGKIYRSLSKDQGLTWSAPEPTALVAPDSPATVKRIPTTGDLLIIWNNTTDPSSLHLPHLFNRKPLTAAISRDEGRTWANFRNLEGDATNHYAYTSVLFLDSRALMTYWVGSPNGKLYSLKEKIVDVSWFYGK